MLTATRTRNYLTILRLPEYTNVNGGKAAFGFESNSKSSPKFSI